jgi:hypothetical protein
MHFAYRVHLLVSCDFQIVQCSIDRLVFEMQTPFSFCEAETELFIYYLDESRA